MLDNVRVQHLMSISINHCTVYSTCGSVLFLNLFPFNNLSSPPAPILTILGSGSSEVIYTCLQHVQLLLARQPEMWSESYQNFFCRYMRVLLVGQNLRAKFYGHIVVLTLPITCTCTFEKCPTGAHKSIHEFDSGILSTSHPSSCLSRYNDPPYLKVKKLEVLTELCNMDTAHSIVDELG